MKLDVTLTANYYLLALPIAFQAEHYARKRMFLPQREKPEAIRELVERNSKHHIENLE